LSGKAETLAHRTDGTQIKRDIDWVAELLQHHRGNTHLGYSQSDQKAFGLQTVSGVSMGRINGIIKIDLFKNGLEIPNLSEN
jgi:hypothetical protein